METGPPRIGGPWYGCCWGLCIIPPPTGGGPPGEPPMAPIVPIVPIVPIEPIVPMAPIGGGVNPLRWGCKTQFFNFILVLLLILNEYEYEYEYEYLRERGSRPLDTAFEGGSAAVGAGEGPPPPLPEGLRHRTSEPCELSDLEKTDRRPDDAASSTRQVYQPIFMTCQWFFLRQLATLNVICQSARSRWTRTSRCCWWNKKFSCSNCRWRRTRARTGKYMTRVNVAKMKNYKNPIEIVETELPIGICKSRNGRGAWGWSPRGTSALSNSRTKRAVNSSLNARLMLTRARPSKPSPTALVTLFSKYKTITVRTIEHYNFFKSFYSLLFVFQAGPHSSDSASETALIRSTWTSLFKIISNGWKRRKKPNTLLPEPNRTSASKRVKPSKSTWESLKKTVPKARAKPNRDHHQEREAHFYLHRPVDCAFLPLLPSTLRCPQRPPIQPLKPPIGAITIPPGIRSTNGLSLCKHTIFPS